MEKPDKSEWLAKGLAPARGGLCRHGNFCYDPAPYGPSRFSLAVARRTVELFCGLGPGRLDSPDSAALDGIDAATWIDITIARSLAT